MCRAFLALLTMYEYLVKAQINWYQAHWFMFIFSFISLFLKNAKNVEKAKGPHWRKSLLPENNFLEEYNNIHISMQGKRITTYLLQSVTWGRIDKKMHINGENSIFYMDMSDL